ncbi:DUF5133 domain-containing protein [Streptomyces sp. ODS28]|uniref:DUF5133 domain-containing protein n=1 Tax=Streptomyces sp. ODS28 TaxID=3136688 RepID=UPI0031EFA091
MLKARPEVLRELVDRYEELRALHEAEGGSHAHRRLEDAAYTLCVSTGTREVRSALAVAREQLAAAGV